MNNFPSDKHIQIDGHASSDNKQRNFFQCLESNFDGFPSMSVVMESNIGFCRNPP